MAPSPCSSLSGANVLISGGSGTFGHAFTRYALAHGARKVVLYSRGEAKQAAMRAAFGDDPRLRFLIGDVRDYPRLLDACRGIDIVIHAAALKRVETCEADPAEAIATNITGTQYVARACIERGVRQAVFLSTDKAAAPNTLYGMTKATAERAWLQWNVYAAGTGTQFSATRYGNVIGSTGSVIPLWRSQVLAGQPLTITDPACTRFWMTIEEAVALVGLALRTMRGGELYVPKIGAASLETLADTVAPAHPRRTVGLRPSEKLHETLIAADEAADAADCGPYYVLSATHGPALHLPRGFTYRSDTARALTPAELHRMCA